MAYSVIDLSTKLRRMNPMIDSVDFIPWNLALRSIVFGRILYINIKLCYYLHSISSWEQQGSKKTLEFQLALGTSSFQILLALGPALVCWRIHDFPDLLPIGQVRVKCYLPGRKIYLSVTMEWHFFEP